MLELPLAKLKAVRASGADAERHPLPRWPAGCGAGFISRGEPGRVRLRVLVPVSMRTRKERGDLRNQVVGVFLPAALTEPDPVERLRSCTTAMMVVKKTEQRSARTALGLGDFAPPQLLAQGGAPPSGLADVQPGGTNVPGPQFRAIFWQSGCCTAFPRCPWRRISRWNRPGSATTASGVGLLGDAEAARDSRGAGKGDGRLAGRAACRCLIAGGIPSTTNRSATRRSRAVLLIMASRSRSAPGYRLPALLARDFRVLVFDNRGTGRSARAGFAYRMRDLADMRRLSSRRRARLRPRLRHLDGWNDRPGARHPPPGAGPHPSARVHDRVLAQGDRPSWERSSTCSC